MTVKSWYSCGFHVEYNRTTFIIFVLQIMDNKPSYSTQRKDSWSIETLLIHGIHFKPLFFLKNCLNQNEDYFIF